MHHATKFVICQPLLLSYGAKIVAGLAAPFFALLLLPKNENLRPRTRHIFLWAVGFIQLGLLIAFGLAAWTVPGGSTSTAIADWVIVLIAAAGGAVPLWIKKDKPVGELLIKV